MKPPTTKTSKVRTIKAWAIFLQDHFYTAYPSENLANMEKEKLEYPDGKEHSFNPYSGVSVVPCKINYSL